MGRPEQSGEVPRARVTGRDWAGASAHPRPCHSPAAAHLSPSLCDGSAGSSTVSPLRGACTEAWRLDSSCKAWASQGQPWSRQLLQPSTLPLRDGSSRAAAPRRPQPEDAPRHACLLKVGPERGRRLLASVQQHAVAGRDVGQHGAHAALVCRRRRGQGMTGGQLRWSGCPDQGRAQREAGRRAGVRVGLT